MPPRSWIPPREKPQTPIRSGRLSASVPPPPPPQKPSYGIPDPPPRNSAGPGITINQTRLAWAIFRACLWTVAILSFVGIVIWFFPILLAFFIQNPVVLLIALFWASSMALVFVRYE